MTGIEDARSFLTADELDTEVGAAAAAMRGRIGRLVGWWLRRQSLAVARHALASAGSAPRPGLRLAALGSGLVVAGRLSYLPAATVGRIEDRRRALLALSRARSHRGR